MSQNSSYTRYLLIREISVFINIRKLQKIAFSPIRQNNLFRVYQF